MTTDNRDLLAVLKSELAFVEKGGYRDAAKPAWRAHFMFQDSPTCLNSDPLKPQRPCTECIMAQFVPANGRERKASCRYIPLNERGETVDSLYRSGTQAELETAVSGWLRATIDGLEKERSRTFSDAEIPQVYVEGKWVEGGTDS